MYRTSVVLDDEFAERMKEAYLSEGYTINGRVGVLIRRDVEAMERDKHGK